MGTFDNFDWQALRKLCAKFGTFVTLVTIQVYFYAKPLDYYHYLDLLVSAILEKGLFLDPPLEVTILDFISSH